jgi:hypothetical protein
MIAPVSACLWCGKAFRSQRRGSPQIFCAAACRSAFHTAGRRWAERAVAYGALTVDDLQNADAKACTLHPRSDQRPSPAPEAGSGISALPEASARFVVEIPNSIIEALVFLFRYLRFDQRDDLPAILAALDRLGRKPTITRAG